jgi:hypothetical protein
MFAERDQLGFTNVKIYKFVTKITPGNDILCQRAPHSHIAVASPGASNDGRREGREASYPKPTSGDTRKLTSTGADMRVAATSGELKRTEERAFHSVEIFPNETAYEGWRSSPHQLQIP